jgi:hypothetical protein
MSYLTVEGAKFLFSKTFGTAVAVTAATNADPTVLSAVAHGFADDDELLFDSGWEDATDTVWKANQLSADTLSLVSLDSSDTQWFPAGTGVGTLRKVSSWVEIGQVLDVNPEGGGAKYMNIEPLSKRNGIKQPIGFEPSGMNFTLGFDPGLTAQAQLTAISRNLSQKVAFKFLLAGGQRGYGYGHAQLSGMPQMRKGSPISVDLSLTFLGQFVGYAT